MELNKTEKEYLNLKPQQNIFSKGQVKIILKKLNKEKLSNTENVVFSVAIKPKLKGTIALNDIALKLL